jgi:hypothetical protein
LNKDRKSNCEVLISKKKIITAIKKPFFAEKRENKEPKRETGRWDVQKETYDD